jgi:L-ascorbate oxidase
MKTFRFTTPVSLGAMLMAAFGPMAAHAENAAEPPVLVEPPVFASRGGSLDLVMIAGPAQTALTQRVTTTAWVYEVCQRTAPVQDMCPAGSAQPLGGVHLQLTAGDTLRIRLVNHLPPPTDAKHVADNPALIGNPTNLHTHGLMVEPHRAEGPDDTYGDYVFLQLLNPANPIAPAATATTGHAAHGAHPDMDVASGAVDYAIQIPANHPSGLYWFHPHVHGVALNQVTAGLSGIITIGTPESMCGDATCVAQVRAGAVRHIVLKDMQVLANNMLQTQEDPDFCGGPDQPPAPAARGVCPGVQNSDLGYGGASWFHTVNGQVYPRIDVKPAGDIWRILNSSPSRSYELSLGGDDTGAPVLMQVLSIDGVTIDSLALDARGTQEMTRMLGGKAKPVPCPRPSGSSGPGGLCTTTLRLMPSARAEVRVVKQKAQTATLRTALYYTGGDSWPAIDLAHVTFAPGNDDVLPPIVVGTQGYDAMSSTGALMGNAALRPRGSMSLVDIDTARGAAGGAVTGSAHHEGVVQAQSIAIDPDLKLGLRSSPDCVPLKEGHHRRVFFGDPTPGVDGFGLGYVEVDEKGREIEATRKPVQSFDPASTTVCIPLGSKGVAVKEVWELINLTEEDHNFHIHQTRFRLLSGGTVSGTAIPTTLQDGLVLHDNVPLPRAANTDNCDGSIANFASGACRPVPVVVEIPFREIGDFVYHCHILEHEDGGMMARIRVVAPPKQAGQAANDVHIPEQEDGGMMAHSRMAARQKQTEPAGRDDRHHHNG